MQMTKLRNVRLACLAAAVVGLTVAGCKKDPVTPSTGGGGGQPTTTCIDFEDQPVQSQFNSGWVLMADSVSVTVEQFQWLNQVWTTGGFACFDNQQVAGGTCLDLDFNNCNLSFGFAYPGQTIFIHYGEYGGNVNLRVNQKFQNVANVANFQSVGGVTDTHARSG